MKKTDWALVVLIVGVVAVASWFIIGSILPTPTDETVKVAPVITSNIEAPENNVVMYDTDRPSWCPRGGSSSTVDVDDNETEVETDGEETEIEKNDDDTKDSNSSSSDTSGKQYINTAFNSCAINSSFTTTTE